MAKINITKKNTEVEEMTIDFKYSIEKTIKVEKVSKDVHVQCQVQNCENRALYSILYTLFGIDVLLSSIIRGVCEEHKDMLGELKYEM